MLVGSHPGDAWHRPYKFRRILAMAVTESSVATTCKLLIDGQWQESTAVEFGEVANPSTGEVIARVPMGGADDINRAVQAAHAAFPAWNDTPIVERARV